MRHVRQWMAQRLYDLGLSADFLSVLGLGCAVLSGALIYRGFFQWAACALLLSGFLDLMDGSVARLSKANTALGGILDSCLDRYGDGVVMAGILFYYAGRDHFLFVGLAMSAAIGSFLISYVRARAECEIPACRVGFWERGERIVFIALGLFLGNLPVVLWILGVGTHWTAAARLWYARRQWLQAEENSSGAAGLRLVGQGPSRTRLRYYVQCSFLLLALLLVRKIW